MDQARGACVILYIRTSQRKVRSTVHLGPPDLIKSRTFTLRVGLALQSDADVAPLAVRREPTG